MATRLFRKPRPDAEARHSKSAIIDIGSNSIRLVVYGGPRRLPGILFNEKVLAGLGRNLSDSGEIAEEALALARPALARFAAMAREMKVDDLHTVATAAVREASNGHELLDFAASLGLDVMLLSGEEEALAAGRGVLSAIPDADGIVGDLGGGSLELVRVANGEIQDRASFPLGVLRIGALREKRKRGLEKRVAALLGDAGWSGRGKGLPFYLVGGSWRALARLDMHLTGYPLPVIHNYTMGLDNIARLRRTISHVSNGKLRSIPNLSSGRVPTLGDAGALLTVLLQELGSENTVVSAYGLREGLLYGALDKDEQRQDPLIVAAREEGRRLGRFPEHGDLLDEWIAPLFVDEDAEMTRLRHVSCLLADVGWRANPDFRAERGLEIALHGNWVAIDAWGRALVAQALFTSLGGGTDIAEPLHELAELHELERAVQWGLAMRFGQRWSGGVAGPLNRSFLLSEHGAITLGLTDDADRALYSETVERRHRALADGLKLEPRVEVFNRT
ncbi:Ppx/GppA family phosphatase [Stakelama marina]|uniref:Ppx/GppA family phosphatase n=1 Tax=Stakelama marina TaxID=2826939 RepID=A0A8T4IAN9_9SPHN|nr:Ppx/GppA family phosphatase [Stakelama marina]MBR0551610.1 Ppx/GppA family phosphatase [Stakelama marina]